MLRNAHLTIENDGSLVHNWGGLRFCFEESRKREQRERRKRWEARPRANILKNTTRRSTSTPTVCGCARSYGARGCVRYSGASLLPIRPRGMEERNRTHEKRGKEHTASAVPAAAPGRTRKERTETTPASTPRQRAIEEAAMGVAARRGRRGCGLGGQITVAQRGRVDGIGRERRCDGRSRRKRKEAENKKKQGDQQRKETAPSRGNSDGLGLHKHSINAPTPRRDSISRRY